MKKCIFKGVATALATPVNQNGIDYNELDKLIEWQLEQGIKALVIAGTKDLIKEVDDFLNQIGYFGLVLKNYCIITVMQIGHFPHDCSIIIIKQPVKLCLSHFL